MLPDSAGSAAGVPEQQEQIKLLLAGINDAWLKGASGELSEVLNGCFREDAVIRGPNLQELGRGREACVKSYADFVQQAEVRHCRFSEPTIDVFGDAAMASYSWKITYVLGGREYSEQGRDLFALTRTDGRWWAAWRAVLMAPAP